MPVTTAHGLQPMVQKGYDIESGDYSYGTPAVRWKHEERQKYRLRIGRYCSIAADAEIFVGTQGRHPADFLTTYPIGLVHGPFTVNNQSQAHEGDLSVSIGCDVWLGRSVIVQAGTTIGHGAIVGARALVTSDLPPYSVSTGIPAKPMRFRFNDAQIKKLLDLRWWDLSASALKANIDCFRTHDIDEAISQLRMAWDGE